MRLLAALDKSVWSVVGTHTLVVRALDYSESSSKGKFTLTVVVDKDEGAVAHFRILTNNMDDKIRMSCCKLNHSPQCGQDNNVLMLCVSA